MLKKILLLAAAAAFVGAGAPARPQSSDPAGPRHQGQPPPAAQWERMTFPGEEFSVEWPDTPFAIPGTRRVKGTEFEQERTWYFGVYSDGVVFRLTSYDKPRRAETLEYFIGELTGRGHRLSGWKRSREVAAGGFTGVEFIGEGASVGAARVFRTKQHVYVLEAFSRGGNHASIGRLLNSLTLGANPLGRKIEIPVVNATVGPPPTGPGSGGGAGDPPERPAASADARPATEPFQAKEVSSKAVIVFKPEPGFTEEARQNNVTGLVRLRAVLGSSGRVTSIFIIKGLPAGLTEKAVQAAHCIQFFPAEKDGRRVSQWITLEYNFHIY